MGNCRLLGLIPKQMTKRVYDTTTSDGYSEHSCSESTILRLCRGLVLLGPVCDNFCHSEFLSLLHRMIHMALGTRTKNTQYELCFTIFPCLNKAHIFLLVWFSSNKIKHCFLLLSVSWDTEVGVQDPKDICLSSKCSEDGCLAHKLHTCQNPSVWSRRVGVEDSIICTTGFYSLSPLVHSWWVEIETCHSKLTDQILCHTTLNRETKMAHKDGEHSYQVFLKTVQ